jgi:Family of unknown function (DUF6152)
MTTPKIQLPTPKAITLAAALVLTCATPTLAHHSLAAGFDVNKMLTLAGTITEMKWTNPHSWLSIDVKNESGEVEKWAVEFGSTNALLRNGWRRDDLPAGVTVTVTGYVARDGSKQISATGVKLPDGRTLFAGQAPASGN